MKRIIIVGAGIGGLRCALELEKKIKKSNIEIILIDEKNYHLFHSNLYEVATSPEELSSLIELKHSVALPIKHIVKKRKIKFLQGKVNNIDFNLQKVKLGDREIFYNFLVLAMGASPNFYGILGADKFANTLSSISDALRIRNKLEFLVQSRRMEIAKMPLRIVIAGGGFTGVELACELQGFFNFLSWKNNFPREKIETLVVEGAATILSGLHTQVISKVCSRLEELGVRTETNSFITKVEEFFIEFKNGEKLRYDCLIWTAGVRAKTMQDIQNMPEDSSRRILVNSFLQLEKYRNVFVLGDQACVRDASGNTMPGTAPQAIDQAKYVAKVIVLALKNYTFSPYMCKKIGYIIPLGGKKMFVKSGPIFIVGYLGYFIRLLVFLNYFAFLIGWRQAYKLILLESRLYSRND